MPEGIWIFFTKLAVVSTATVSPVEYISTPSSVADKIEYLTPEQEGNIAAYNAMKAFAMGMENNLSSIVILKSHSTAEISQAAALLEKDIRAIIQYIMNLQIPL